MKVEDLPLYFDEDDDSYYIKNGYTCIHGGFTDHMITIITDNSDGSYIFMTADDHYRVTSKAWQDVDVYELTKVT